MHDGGRSTAGVKGRAATRSGARAPAWCECRMHAHYSLDVACNPNAAAASLSSFLGPPRPRPPTWWRSPRHAGAPHAPACIAQRGTGGDAMIIKIEHEENELRVEEQMAGATLEAIGEKLDREPRYVLYIHKVSLETAQP